MNNYIKSILLFFIITSLLCCKENEVQDFTEDSWIYFYEFVLLYGYPNRTNEKTVSFAVQDADVQVIESNIQTRLLGRIVDYDRKYKVKFVADSSSAIQGQHFEIEDGVLKAGEYLSSFPIKLFRTPDLKGRTVNIVLEIDSSDDFNGNYYDALAFKFTVGDVLTRPQNWPQQYFGDYSDNKYQFVLDVLKISDFPQVTANQAEIQEGQFTSTEMRHFLYILNEEYDKYRLTNPPIYMDDDAEFKREITFP